MQLANLNLPHFSNESIKEDLKRTLLENTPIVSNNKHNLADELLGSIGVMVGADNELCNIIARQIRRNFHKAWSQLSVEEWRIFEDVQPASSKYLREVIKVNIKTKFAKFFVVKENLYSQVKNRFLCHVIDTLCGAVGNIEARFGGDTPLVDTIEGIKNGDIREAVDQLLLAYDLYGGIIETQCCKEQLLDEIEYQIKAIDELTKVDSVFAHGASVRYRKTLKELKSRLSVLSAE
ncbi:MAG: hypothetical protein D6B28_11055 [Gammaproteobacteria bacterium]|nr:MAG: hypothetical protein D6B28_11055 [Gammaproteobacteria bacterium]